MLRIYDDICYYFTDKYILFYETLIEEKETEEMAD